MSSRKARIQTELVHFVDHVAIDLLSTADHSDQYSRSLRPGSDGV